ncbi:DUF6586 family protein [Marinobacter alkaliphilus]|uniref:DUF6586 family protein n=1 Tax=Marinobacter alkaliphilus TaxID=254719 RepID=UPI003D767460
MASQWYSLVAQKLFLANTLLTRLESDTKRSAAETEALSQGSAELLLRARQTLLVMIARYHQHKAEKPQTLAELETLFPYEVHETRLLRELAETSGSWWNHLDQVESALSQPPTTRKNVTEENIIAVSVEQGPDRSAATLRKTLAAMTELAKRLEEQHSEW